MMDTMHSEADQGHNLYHIRDRVVRMKAHLRYVQGLCSLHTQPSDPFISELDGWLDAVKSCVQILEDRHSSRSFVFAM
ncbi:hypothetical protein CONPUDRAFT_139003 [Coniophora puteana RWD-64-598 SS2]|uniref:Uncharacterized protein n=1 Tax=Coniophora puteana (strain RWD-64-598) TaxID=741705 RepID=A0A5M3MGS6_CONPW|nr:uncharacterized protein CONPUDRAFT_139003 [Coniophora puteana RWD-64-598 SS2]EIW77835.1 hypothetical protein CONPUDRAFT_139003 [Coniophora puteana RWD-64-598 SS2]